MKTSPLVRGYEVVIGLETHAQLHTRSKAFSGSATTFGAAPNTQASAIDLALPGTLPVLNRAAVECAIRFGLAVGARIAGQSIFARKNYFYPDLPKGYQISQYETPVVQGGRVPFMLGEQRHSVALTRAHLEEDAGKSLHEGIGGSHCDVSGIDLNRAGTPLLEIVTEPEMRSAAQAVEYARALHTLVVWLGICDGNMQEGSFRCDANVSVRKPGAALGTRREIKNLNSFRFMQQAIEFEVNWQIDRLEDGLAVEQATVLFDPDSGETRAMRTKEDAHDYRYFPDPDLPPLVISPQWIAEVKSAMPELPGAMAERFVGDDGLPAYDAAMMTQSLAFARYYEAARDACKQPKLVANWMMGEVSKRLNAKAQTIEEAPVSPATLARLIGRVVDGTVSNSGARQVFDHLWAAGKFNDGRPLSERFVDVAIADPGVVDQAIDNLGLKQMSDTGALEAIVDQVLAANPKSIDEYKAGKDKAFNALVGQVMKASQGKANPGQVNELLKK
ncbi:MAG TPA: Asp-tRNA(Asn)/Glu-tRNA(Gln) amidotransferase subunit GatB, partial [Burkholderiaceae bacterium]|nr:Asp-tRNA(Asn)/Glu-tRNA(Gln) amidotransferase subunit GatB [Burkholderiaceae bacterium]